jgi:hypothetical protein
MKSESQKGRTVHVHCAVMLEVVLVPDEDDGHRFRVFDAQDLFVECTNQVKRVPFRDWVHEEEALAVEHVVLPHRTVFHKGTQMGKACAPK